jgi:phage tail sheath protein FI
MPEYLAPGVYVEEVSFRSKSLEGVPTSTTGYAGMTRFGPVQYAGGPTTTEPRLITSFTEFERVYGSLETLFTGATEGTAEERIGFTAHAARAFFANGGKRLYISRVFVPRESAPNVRDDFGTASFAIAVGGNTATWRARWPGRFGNVLVETRLVRTKNVAFAHPTFGIQANRAKAGSVVEIAPAPVNPGDPLPPAGNAPLSATQAAVVAVDADGRQTFFRGGADVTGTIGATDVIQLVEMQALVTVDTDRIDVYNELAGDAAQRRSITKILQPNDPEDENAVVWLDWTPTAAEDAAQLMIALRGTANPGTGSRLTGGHDGDLALPDDLAGQEADPDNAAVKATGLAALGEMTDIAIVALPDGGTYDDAETCGQAADRLIAHCETLRYRFGVVDAPAGSSMTEIRSFRGRFDTRRAAIYHPWIEILDPLQRPSQGAPQERLMLPPSGSVTGIYARSDIERGVHKAPANEVVRGLTKFEANINKARQDVLNPEGINALRFFENRGNRVWGARTMSSDPEWKYVNVMRLFIYIEHTIDIGTQWAVFEPNNSRLWANIRETVENFLRVLWRDGALLGEKPEEAYFVRCDRTTMTQNDLDNGRLICLIGIAPVKPAEFVIFRIGQWTSDANK